MTIIEIAKQIKTLTSALIFCHQNPDGDTLSCAFSLQYALKKLGISSDIICPDQVPDKFLKTGMYSKVLQNATKPYDGYIAVDCASETQVGLPYEIFARQKKTFCIDHHITNSKYAKSYFVKDCASCTMLIADLIEALGVKTDKTLATYYYLGLMTDTGNFAHSNTDKDAFSFASKCMEYEIDTVAIYNSMYKANPKNWLLMHAEIMSKARFFHDNKMALVVLSQDILKKYGLNKSHTDGTCEFLMQVESVDVGVSVYEHSPNCYKLSLRSKKSSAREIASVFGGGGHEKAAGLMIHGFLEDVIDKIAFTVGNYLEC